MPRPPALSVNDFNKLTRLTDLMQDDCFDYSV